MEVESFCSNLIIDQVVYEFVKGTRDVVSQVWLLEDSERYLVDCLNLDISSPEVVIVGGSLHSQNPYIRRKAKSQVFLEFEALEHFEIVFKNHVLGLFISLECAINNRAGSLLFGFSQWLKEFDNFIF